MRRTAHARRRLALAILAALATILTAPAAALAANPGINLPSVLHQFFSSWQLHTAAALIAVDLAVGIAAAVHRGTFRLSYLADFAKNDLLYKLVPWLAIYAGATYAGGALAPASDAVYALIVAAWTGSIASSLLELGLQGAPQTLRTTLAGPEKTPPPPAPPPRR